MKPRLKETDRCVMCGLCLPHCPTYALTRQEADSPRGRISLMQGMASGQLTADDRVAGHLEACLGCRACEAMCPSGVPFGRLMDEARALLIEKRAEKPQAQTLTATLVRGDRKSRAMAGLLHTGQRLGLIGALGLLPGLEGKPLGRALDLLPRRSGTAQRPGIHEPRGEAVGKVYLFTGCTGAAFEGASLKAARDLLLRLNYRVEIPGNQVCCGALDQHAGRQEAAVALARRNLEAFPEPGCRIISLNSGCRTQLREYPEHLSAEEPTPDPDAFAHRVRDLCGFLMEHDLGALNLMQTPITVAVHLPCTLRNVLKEHGNLLGLLARLPGVRVLELEGNDRCCGAAGTHMLTHPEAADALLAPKVEAARRQTPHVILSGNIGCNLHLQAGLRRAGLKVPVMSLAEWLVSRCQGSNGK